MSEEKLKRIDTLMGIIAAICCTICIAAGIAGWKFVFIYASLILIDSLVYLGLNKNGSLGPFTIPWAIINICWILAYAIGLTHIEVTLPVKIVLGFPVGFAAIVYLYWLPPFLMEIMHGVKFDEWFIKGRPAFDPDYKKEGNKK